MIVAPVTAMLKQSVHPTSVVNRHNVVVKCAAILSARIHSPSQTRQLPTLASTRSLSDTGASCPRRGSVLAKVSSNAPGPGADQTHEQSNILGADEVQEKDVEKLLHQVEMQIQSHGPADKHGKALHAVATSLPVNAVAI